MAKVHIGEVIFTVKIPTVSRIRMCKLEDSLYQTKEGLNTISFPNADLELISQCLELMQEFEATLGYRVRACCKTNNIHTR